MSLTLEITGDAMTLQLGDNAPLELELEADALTLELGAVVSFVGLGGARVLLAADTTLEITDGTGNTYVNDDVPIVVELPTSTEIGNAQYRARFVLAFGQSFRVKAQGADVLRYYGEETPAGGYLEIGDRDAVLDVELTAAGIFTVTNAEREWSLGP